MPDNPDAAAEKPAEKAAPWGADFDASRAWQLVTNLRTELDDAKKERNALKTAAESAADSEKSELQKAIDKIQKLEERAAGAERKLVVGAALREHGLADDFADFLTGTPEEIAAKAARLAALNKPAAEESSEAEQQPDPLAAAAKPTPDLVPGHGGDAEPAFDPVAIAAAARRR